MSCSLGVLQGIKHLPHLSLRGLTHVLQVVLPPPEANGARWDWEGPWEVELAGHVDSEGCE